MPIVVAFQKNVRIVNHQKNVQTVQGKNVVAIMRLKMADNLEQYIVIGVIAAAVAMLIQEYFNFFFSQTNYTAKQK